MNGVKELAYQDYVNGMKYKEIADKYGVSLSTIKSWATRFWKQKKLQPSDKKVATKNDEKLQRLQPKKKSGGQPNNKNAIGSGAPKGNQNATTHGLFSKYLPPDILGIVMDLNEVSPIDILWQNILIQHAKLLHAQKILFVKDSNDHTTLSETTATRKLDGSGARSDSITKAEAVVVAHLKETKAMIAMSSAQRTLMAMIKQYDDLCRSPLATEEQVARIEHIRANVEQIKGVTDDDDVMSDSGFIEALKPIVKEVWADEDKT